MTPKLKDVPSVTDSLALQSRAPYFSSFLDSKFSNLGGNVVL